MTKEQMDNILSMDAKEQEIALRKFSRIQVDDFKVYAASPRKKESKLKKLMENKAIRFSVKYLWIFLIVISAIVNTAEFFSQKSIVETEAKTQIETIYKKYACIHGIDIDGQWFKTANDAFDYVREKYISEKYFVLFYSINTQSYEYQYHTFCY